MDVQTLAPFALIALPIVMCIVIVIRVCSASLSLREQKQEARHRAQQEHQELCTQERLRQAVVQKEVELRLLHILADLHQLSCLMSLTEDTEWYVQEDMIPLNERRIVLVSMIHLFYSMAFDHRVTLHEVESLEAQTQDLWRRYHLLNLRPSRC